MCFQVILKRKTTTFDSKVSFINGFEALSSYYHPAIDYHLIRSYLRRGIIICKTKKAWDYINNVEANRTERTVAAIRMHCSNMINAISLYTHLDISTINLISGILDVQCACKKKQIANWKLRAPNG